MLKLSAVFFLSIINNCTGSACSSGKHQEDPESSISAVSSLWRLFIPLNAEAALIVNSVTAVPVSETIPSVCFPTERVSR